MKKLVNTATPAMINGYQRAVVNLFLRYESHSFSVSHGRLFGGLSQEFTLR